MFTNAALATVPDFDHRDDEALAASEWARLIGLGRPDGFSVQAFNKAAVAAEERLVRNGIGQLVKVYRFRNLPERWREELTRARSAQGVSLCRDLLEIAERAEAWVPPKPWNQLPPATQEKAMLVRRVMIAFYAWLEQGRAKTEAYDLARAEWLKLFGEACHPRTIRRYELRLEARGAKYIPITSLRLEAFCDGKSCAHPAARKSPPPEFERWFAAQFLDPRKGVPGMGAIFAECEAAWASGAEIPGLGARQGEEPFPFTTAQLRPLLPGYAARVVAGKGKFLAKTGGYLAAPPLDWTNIEPGRVVMFDDKTIDLEVLTDDGTKVFRPVIYIAYCAGTRRVLAYIVREDDCARQLDVEGLMAAVMAQHGIGGPETGWRTIFILERGTVAISTARAEFLEAFFAGRLEIRRTAMIGGQNAPGDYVQQGKGNFFGKGVIESFMGSLDCAAKRAPGATGNRFDAAPAALGDTTGTIQKIINAARQGHSGNRSLIEESLVTATFARLWDYLETGEGRNAREAAQRAGIKPPLLFFSDFVAVLGEFFRAHNARRGHRMQGFADVRVPHPDPEIAATGRVLYVAESPNDKAARMLDAMALAGRGLVAPAREDVFALLHKVRRVTARANGIVIKGLGSQGEDYRYWAETSQALRDAVNVQGGEKTFLALYNPVDPAALYLLANPPSHLPAKATELPPDITPRLYEVLPLYSGPSIVDEAGMKQRAASVAAFNSRPMRELLVKSAPIIEMLDADRVVVRDRLDSLNVSLRVAHPTIAPATAPASDLGLAIAGAEEAVANPASAEVTTRAAQAASAADRHRARLAARAKEKNQP